MVSRAFSWKQAKEDAIKKHIERAHSQAKANNNPDFITKHPDWVRDAQLKSPQYTLMDKQIREEKTKMQEKYQARIERRKSLK